MRGQDSEDIGLETEDGFDLERQETLAETSMDEDVVLTVDQVKAEVEAGPSRVRVGQQGRDNNLEDSYDSSGSRR